MHRILFDWKNSGVYTSVYVENILLTSYVTVIVRYDFILRLNFCRFCRGLKSDFLSCARRSLQFFE